MVTRGVNRQAARRCRSDRQSRGNPRRRGQFPSCQWSLRAPYTGMEMRSLRSPHLLLSFLVLLVCAGVCSAGEQDVVHQATPENYRVYSASLPFGYHTAGLAIAIRSRTIAVPDLTNASNSVQKEFASMQQDPALGAAIREMLAQSPLDLAPRFHTSEAVEMLNSDELDGQLHLKDTPLARKS